MKSGQELSQVCSIFVLAKNEQCQLIRELMGLIATSFLGTCGSPACTGAAARSPLHLGALQVRMTLALEDTNYYIVFLGLETLFRLSGASPVTLPPGWAGWG